jgi:rod shape-determining protein MreB
VSKEKASVLHLGIDLGTSRSSVSASNGERHVLDSYVGWPVDMVARKIVKKPVLFGSEALDNRPMLDLHRPLERGLIKEGSQKDEMAVHELLSHLISLAKPESGQSVFVVVGVPAEALRVNRQHLRNAVSGVADSLMIVSEPFAVAYGLDALLHTMIIDIGAGTTDFCVMNGRYPTDDDQRTLTNAGDSVDELLATAVRARAPEARFSVHMVRQWKESWSFVGEPRRPVTVTVPVKGAPTTVDITADMRKAC